ncbi:MAG: Gfo/Idh/MocA family oxidoreductase [Acidobacteriota bacterium]
MTTVILQLLCVLLPASPRTTALGAKPLPAQQPVRVVIARLTHSHVGGILGRAQKGDIQVVGIYETDNEVVERYHKRFNFDKQLVQTDLAKMLDTLKPEAVVAFGSIAEHLSVVEAAAPRRINVMVEKPLAFSVDDANKIEALAKRYGIHVLTNYETTWYPSGYTAFQLVQVDKAVGPIRKIVIHDGHQGPKEIGIPPEFLSWLTDPAQNGAGALIDFGCYGANLATWLMNGAAPLTVTAVTQKLKRDPVYARVDDEATFILTYPDAQAIIQGSWNWPYNRKDLEIYGTTGYVFTPDGKNVRARLPGQQTEQAITLKEVPAHYGDAFAYLAAVIRGTEKVAATDRSSLANNLTVVRILDAGRTSARTGKTVSLK